MKLFVQNQHRLVYKQIQKLVQKQVQTEFQFAQISEKQIEYQALYSILKQEPMIMQISPQKFVKFQDNLQQIYQQKMSQFN